jgi:outer membrane phospholipase A
MPLTLLGFSGPAPDSVEIGFQHRSDGQVTEITSAQEAGRAARAYEAGDIQYFDTISRSANYFSVAWDQVGLLGRGVDLRAKLKLYTGQQDSAITWGPLADRGLRFSDYDRLTLRGKYRFGKQHVELEWRVGDKGLATDSWTLGYEWDGLYEVPLYLRWHRGPMNTLSNYTQRQDSFGFGLKLARF